MLNLVLAEHQWFGPVWTALEIRDGSKIFISYLYSAKGFQFTVYGHRRGQPRGKDTA